MSFIEGLIICFFGGWINSYLYSYHLRKNHKGALFWIAFIFLSLIILSNVLIFYNIFDVGIFRALPWINLSSEINLGKYWMFTPGLIVGLPMELPVKNYNGLAWDLFAIFFYFSYIFWFIIGQNLGRFMYGRLSYEKGAWYLLRSTKMIQRSKKKLEKQKENDET